MAGILKYAICAAGFEKNVEKFLMKVYRSKDAGMRNERVRHVRGINIVRARDGRVLQLLEVATKVLDRLNDEQQWHLERGLPIDELDETGRVAKRVWQSVPKQEFSEFSTLRAAFTAADQFKVGDDDKERELLIYTHIYASAADVILGAL